MSAFASPSKSIKAPKGLQSPGAMPAAQGQNKSGIVNTEQRRQALENARNMENLKKIQAMLTQGIPFAKHNRKGQVKKRILRSVDLDATMLMWMPTKGEEYRGPFASSASPRRTRDIVMVQSANEPDPSNPDYGGTHTLRMSAGRKAVFKSLSLHFVDRTLDCEFDSVGLFNEVYEGLKLLVTHHKMAAAQEEYALYYAEQNAKNKMAWVPTTDAQARTYFYNLYTRETAWVPPPGAPRIELEHWEKSFLERKSVKPPPKGFRKTSTPLKKPSQTDDDVERKIGVEL